MTAVPLPAAADAIMVMSIDNVHHKVKLTSIMRDVRVYMGERQPV